MNHDDIIEEVRTIREHLAARHNYNVRALFVEAKQRQQESDVLSNWRPGSRIPRQHLLTSETGHLY